MQRQPRRNQGIRVRHRRSCTTRAGGRCDCTPTYEAEVYSVKDKTKIRQSFSTVAAAKGWRADASAGVRKGTLRAPKPTTLNEAWTAWLAGASAGTIRTRSYDAFKPSALRGYEHSMVSRVLPELGAARLSAITRLDLQDFANRMLAEGKDPSTIRNTLMPLRAVYRLALHRGDVQVNPTAGLQLPAVRGVRDRFAAPDEAAVLLAALGDDDRAIWATAMYAGLRRGELLGLRWEDVDLGNNRISVERSYDPLARQFVAPKSRAGVRVVPIVALLREHLRAHRLRAGRSAGLVFGPSAEVPFDCYALARRARQVWKEKKLTPIGLHECRHTAASIFIAARVNPKAICSLMGHASVTITLDRYGHLMPGNEDETAGLVDAYLANFKRTAER